MTTATLTPTPPSIPAETQTPTPRPVDFVREWLDELGNVPLERIVMDPPPGTATEADCVRINESKRGALVELIDGTLVRKIMGQFESAVGMVVGSLLRDWQRENMPGTVTGEQGMIRMSVGNIRMPNVAFYPKSQFPDGRFPRDKIGNYPALLAVEVFRQSNTEAEIDAKLREYFASGTRLVWVIDPVAETLRIYDTPDKPDTFRQIGNTDTLTGSEVLPSFSVPVADLFDI